MRMGLLMTVITLVALGGAGCDTQPIEVAPAGAAVPVDIPVGPIPGPGSRQNQFTNPYAENPIALAEGRKLFVWFNCAGCHGGRGGGGMGPSLRDAAWIYGSSDGHIFDSIAEGRAHGMPAWGVKLPQEQIWKLAAYIDSMGTPLEPQPPTVEQTPKVRIDPEMKR